MKIIPAIDLIDGKCVRLSKGDYDTQKEYPATPVEMAQKFEDVGITYLHLVDLDGARAGVPKNLSVLRAISESTNLQVDFSGGLRTEEDIAAAFKAGATFVAVGSAAVKDPGEVSRWLSKFGAERFVLGADVRGQKLAVSGWQEDTDVTITEYVSRWRTDGVARFLCTSIEKY
ncbi:MAG: 1-(5-phosphoribosyl)-5-[(5-phosphoribosylamino)methylideneamino] imidazole-4-carboxamide isomerase [Bdellovibrionales bacterium]|nr:1-(5-phosphoribosyl)-5-[(5-phosphoribosylamino)methylideneamino] imidazole-4-carboxamide isomerase [Bdellovibrionales bacterium]